MTDWQIGWTWQRSLQRCRGGWERKRSACWSRWACPRTRPERLDEIIRGILDCCECAGGEILGEIPRRLRRLHCPARARRNGWRRRSIHCAGAPKKGGLLAPITGSLGWPRARLLKFHQGLSLRAQAGGRRPCWDRSLACEGMALSANSDQAALGISEWTAHRSILC